MNKFAKTMQIIRRVRKETSTAVLFYSAGGKDSIALIDMLAKEFDKVICYYMYLIKDLDHIFPYIEWAETTYDNIEIRQILHYQMDSIKKVGIFCDPDPNIKVRKVGDVEEMVRQETGEKYVFSGMKGYDGYMKRMRLKRFAKNDYITEKGMVYPLAEWTNKEVMKYIEVKNLIKPFVYKGQEKEWSQGFSLSLPILLMMYERFPNDYDKMLQEFPYLEKLIFDYNRGIVPKGQEYLL